MHRISRRLARAAFTAALLTPFLTSAAQDFTGHVGLGVAALPRYAGSDEYRVLAVPVLLLEYKGRLYVGGSQSGVGAGIGAYLVRTASVTWDLGLAGSEARPESRGDALAGMGKRASASYASTTLTYRAGILSATAGIAVGLGDEEGSYGAVTLAAQRRIGDRLLGALTTGVTVADAQNMTFEFGVTPAQSTARRTLAAAGDPRLRGIDTRAYAPDAGLKQVNGGATLAYLFTARTHALLFAQATHLTRDAYRSPIVRTRLGTAAGVALAYSF